MVGIEPADPPTANRLVEPWTGSMWAHPSFSRMWAWYDPKAGGNCGDLGPYLQGDTTGREPEEHWSGPTQFEDSTMAESHCIRPGVYRFWVGDYFEPLKAFLIDYVPIVPASPGANAALQVWNQTAGVYETIEARNPDDTGNVWADLVANVDIGTTSYGETRALWIQNAHSDPEHTLFQDEPSPSGSETDWFRFSVAGSTSEWPQTEGKALARLYWDFSRSKTDWTTNYYDAITPNGRIIRLHRFADHVKESREAVVALELMRPDEDPKDTINVTQRVIQITLANEPPTASFTSSCDSLTCSFTDASSDPGGTIVSRLWTFGDGDSSTVLNPIHAYDSPDFYDVRLIVTDNGGTADTLTQTVPVALVTITDPDWITRPRTYAWNVNVTAGTPPHTYQWWYRPFGPGGQWQLVGTASSYSLYVGYANLGFTLRCDVGDAADFSASDTHLVSTDWGYRPMTGGPD
jgi:PKD repeat protein